MTVSRWTGLEWVLTFVGALLVLCAASLVAFVVVGALPALAVAAAQLDPAAARPAVAAVARLLAWRWAVVGGWLAAVALTLLLVRSMARPGVKMLVVGLVATSASALLLGLMFVLSLEPLAQVMAALNHEHW